jgi:23S rRNA (guanosine2251-2'-O)-methyltransferase
VIIGDLLYGFHPVRELLRHRPEMVFEVLIAARPGKRRSEIEDLCQQHHLSVRSVAFEDLGARDQGRVHNGFAARQREDPKTAKSHGDSDLLVLVEDVQDPRNLGALIRVAEGAGIGRMMIRDRGSSPLSPTVAKTSAGAIEWLPIERVVNSSRTLEGLKKEGFWVYGTDPAGEPPWSIDLTGKVVLCLGGEGSGLRRHTRESCDALIGLPMRGQVESLNIATAASAVLYEAVRQRLAAKE